jgi:hypothetical protein
LICRARLAEYRTSLYLESVWVSRSSIGGEVMPMATGWLPDKVQLFPEMEGYRINFTN